MSIRTPQRLAVLLLALLLPTPSPAVSPLTTDDADTVEPGRLQLNAGWQFSRASSNHWNAIPINPVLGLSSGELGGTFGIWRDGVGTEARKTTPTG